MESKIRPVDVISLCSADGSIRPLRLRVVDDDRELIRIDIEKIINTQEIPYVGAEAIIFRCQGRAGEQIRVFDLKYLLRKHSWSIL